MQSTKQIRSLLDLIGGTDYGLSGFQRMAAAATPGLADHFALASARGGSFLQAQEAAEGAQRRAMGQAYDAWSNFKNSTIGHQTNLLGMLAENERFEKRNSLWSNILGIGATGLGAFLGGAGGEALVGKLFGGGGGNVSQFRAFPMPQLTFRPHNYGGY